MYNELAAGRNFSRRKILLEYIKFVCFLDERFIIMEK